MKDFFQLRESILKEKTMELAGVTLQHMEHCPGAVAAFKKNLKDGASEADVAKAAKAVDAYLAIEDKAVKAGKATDADVEKMEDLIDKAEKIIAKLGLEGHTYHDMHLDRVEDMVEEEDDEDEDEDEDDDVNEETDVRNLSNRHLSTILRNPNHPMHSVANNELSRRRMARESTQIGEKTLTPAEKKKREEIAKAMERENPGMDMSKKMAIATATAKRVAEANKEYGPGHIGAIQKMLDKEREAKKAKAAMKKEEVELDEAMTAAHKKLAHDVHKQLKRDEPMGLAAGMKLKADHKTLRSKYGADWRKKAGINEEVELDESNLTSDDLHRIAKDHENAAKKHGAAYDETKSSASARSHEIAWDRHVDAAKAHREAAKDKSKHSREKLEKMSNHAWDATDHIRKHFDESVMRDRMKKRNKGMTRAFGGERD